MKKFLACAMLAMFTAGTMVGCKASAEVDDNDGADSSSSYKKTTTVKESDGDKTVKTETKKTY
jgi:hypothetical protein